MFMKKINEEHCLQEYEGSRRQFLKKIPFITAAAAMPIAALAESTDDTPYWAMIVDLRRCIACQACTVACTHENAAPKGNYRTIVSTYAVKLNDTPMDQPAGMHVLPRLCNHCDNPPCVPVCPVGATFKRKDGIVIVDNQRCVGCAYCVQACPYDARFINPQTGTADKCTFCAHRVAVGLLPACVDTCVGGARIFGDLNDKSSDFFKLYETHLNDLKVLKPEMKTRPRVFYLGLDAHLESRVEGQPTLWEPPQA